MQSNKKPDNKFCFQKNNERLLNIISFALFILLVIITVLGFFLPGIAGAGSTSCPSYLLEKRVVVSGNTTRIDYVDSEGNAAYASDKNYATFIKTQVNDRVMLQEYFDEHGSPAQQLSGQYAELIEKDEKGRVSCITYLGTEKEPVITENGFTKLKYSYNNLDQKEYELYFDNDDNQVEHSRGYYGIRREYNNNDQVTKTVYLDKKNKPVNSIYGYAIKDQEYDDNGKVSFEYYYDVKGAPVLISLGYYGIYREYDEYGNTIKITYLAADGHPMDSGDGFATAIYSYNSDGSISTVRYFDSNDNPVTAGRNQYGVEYVNGQGIYLDENGNRLFRLDNFLNTHPFLVLFGGIVLTLVAVMLKGKTKLFFLPIYLLLIIFMTIAFREIGASKHSFELFWSYRQIFVSSSIRQEILSNIWLFLPLGASLYNSSHKHNLIWAICLSLIIEFVQLIFGIGLCEFDDVISNSIGAIIGFGVAMSYEDLISIKKLKTRD